MKQRLSSAPFRCLILGMACTAVSVGSVKILSQIHFIRQ